jgi:hypothetical protein
MTRTLTMIAIAAMLAAASLAIPSRADARTHHRAFGQFGGAYAYAPGYARRYYRRDPRYDAPLWDRQLQGRDWCC